MENRYKSNRIIDGKPKWVIVDDNGNIIDRDPDKEQLKGLFTEYYNRCPMYTDNQLLNYLKVFYQKNGRIPVERDFVNNFEYPSFFMYQKHFGSWNKALKLVRFDIDTRIRQGEFGTERQIGRRTEIIIKNHFKILSMDVSGENCGSYFDGICPNGQIYEVKSSKMYKSKNGEFWNFATPNKDKDDDKEAIQWYYFVAFNENYTKILYVWRIPGELVEKDHFVIGTRGTRGKFCVRNMEEYNIADKFNNVISSELVL